MDSDVAKKKQLAEYWQNWQENEMLKWKVNNSKGSFEEYIQVIRNFTVHIF